jgi:hypothetical protein
MDLAYDTYGTRTIPDPQRTKALHTEATKAWDTIYSATTELLKPHGAGPPPEAEATQLLDSHREGLRPELETLTSRGFPSPPLHHWIDLTKWHKSRDYHRGQITGARDTYKITDAEALSNPKKLTRLICKPPGSSTITALRRDGIIIDDDAGIERELTQYIQTLAGDREPLHKMPAHPTYRGKRRFVHPKLANLTTAKVELEEIQRTLSDLQNDVAAGTLPARLIKIAAHKTWKTKESKPDIQLARERQQHEWDAAQGLAPPNGEISLEMDTHTHPTRSIKLLRMIVEASFRAGDLPNPEKHGIITGLPKADKKTVYAHVSSTTSLRPITVSPIIGRIINNVMAKRFGSALELNNILDPAQFAFLPGRNIHQAISAIVECFTQSNSTPNNTPGRECYAVFYDISNAYPTVKWSSIQQALIEIGAPNPFIDFVVNSLQGTTISMKTNIPGRVTPAVEIHKSIKQGCPPYSHPYYLQ